MAPAPESAPDSVAVKFDIKSKMDEKEEANNEDAETEEPHENKNNQSTGTEAHRRVLL